MIVNLDEHAAKQRVNAKRQGFVVTTALGQTLGGFVLPANQPAVKQQLKDYNASHDGCNYIYPTTIKDAAQHASTTHMIALYRDEREYQVLADGQDVGRVILSVTTHKALTRQYPQLAALFVPCKPRR